MKGLYVHIPFCQYICHYCDFVKTVPKNDNVIDEYLIKLREEILMYKDHFSSIQTVFIGGGTPSMLSPNQLRYLFDSLKGINPIEYSIELNPESYTHEKGLIFKEYGVNRVSVGIQTFDDDILKYLNRAHNKEMVFNVFDDLRKIGINNLSADLIFAIPGQSLNHIKDDLKEVFKLNIPHISYYSLILEDKTFFYHQYLKGKFTPVEEDLEASMYDLIINELTNHGYNQYEISNFCKNDMISLHNNIYWTLGEYIGVGLGAHGFIDGYRTYNERSMSKYMDHFQKEKIKQTKEMLLQDELIFGLRKTNGVSIDYINNTYGVDLLLKYPKLIELKNAGLISINEGRLSLTRKGTMLGNQVFIIFI